jgi:hypothetical protein
MTSGDPAFAQEIAHSLLIGFFKSFVNAQAESSTYPFTVAGESAGFVLPDVARSKVPDSKATVVNRFIKHLPAQ